MILAVYVYDVQNLTKPMCSSVQHGSTFFDLKLPTALINGHTMQNGRVKGGVRVFFLLFDSPSPHSLEASIKPPQRKIFHLCGIQGYLNSWEKCGLVRTKSGPCLPLKAEFNVLRSSAVSGILQSGTNYHTIVPEIMFIDENLLF